MDGHKSIRRVEFGENGAWLIQFTDMSTEWVGIPETMGNKIRSRNPRLPSPSKFALGPNQTWFLGFEDGSCDWSLPTRVSQACQAVVTKGGDVTAVSMCAHSTDFLVRSTVSTG